MINFQKYLINVGIRSHEFSHFDDVIFSNIDYFRKCYLSQLSAYKALLFLQDYLNGDYIFDDDTTIEDGVVYEFLYNSDCCESVPGTVSIHKTKKGAEMSMEFHKNEKMLEHYELYGDEKTEFSFDYDQSWNVRKTKLEE